MTKDALLHAHRARLEATLERLRATRDQARAGTRVDGDHRPANRGERAAVTSQGYLTAGLAERIGELEQSLEAVDRLAPGPRDRVAPGALITVVDGDDREATYLVVPGGQGDALAEGVIAISPRSPIARALAGLRVDEAGEVPRAGGAVEVVIEAIG